MSAGGGGVDEGVGWTERVAASAKGGGMRRICGGMMSRDWLRLLARLLRTEADDDEPQGGGGLGSCYRGLVAEFLQARASRCGGAPPCQDDWEVARRYGAGGWATRDDRVR